MNAYDYLPYGSDPREWGEPEWLYDASEAERPRVRFVTDFGKVQRALRQAHGRHWLVPVLRRLARAGVLFGESERTI
jgi:hypothetical protein